MRMGLSISTVDLINILIVAAGIGVCGMCQLQVSASIHLQKLVRRYFQIFFLLIILYISTLLARQLMDGQPGAGIRAALYAVTFAEVLAAGLMAHMLSMLILSVAKPDRGAKTMFLPLLVLLCLHDKRVRGLEGGCGLRGGQRRHSGRGGGQQGEYKRLLPRRI